MVSLYQHILHHGQFYLHGMLMYVLYRHGMLMYHVDEDEWEFDATLAWPGCSLSRCWLYL